MNNLKFATETSIKTVKALEKDKISIEKSKAIAYNVNNIIKAEKFENPILFNLSKRTFSFSVYFVVVAVVVFILMAGHHYE